MHSPWGMLDHLCEKKGWTLEYVLERISWTNIQMMIADKIQYIEKSEMVVKVSKSGLKEHRKRMQNG